MRTRAQGQALAVQLAAPHLQVIEMPCRVTAEVVRGEIDAMAAGSSALAAGMPYYIKEG